MATSIGISVQPPSGPTIQSELAITMVSVLPSLINPLKLMSEVGAVVVAVVDVVMALAVAVMGFSEVASSA